MKKITICLICSCYSFTNYITKADSFSTKAKKTETTSEVLTDKNPNNSYLSKVNLRADSRPLIDQLYKKAIE